jgi:outer membrane lipoprotein SlyB
VLVALGTLTIPGAGPFLAAGPVLAALSGAAAGATLGGIAGALVGMGIPEIVAKRYEGKISGGNLLIAVHVDNKDTHDIALSIMQRGGAHDVVVANEAPVPS